MKIASMSSSKGKSKIRNRSKSVHTSVPHVLESEEQQDKQTGDENDLSQQLEPGLGSEGSDEWSSGDEEELVKNIRQFTSKSDKVKYTTRVQRLDWSKIAFKKYTPKQCQSHFNNYLKNVRTYRTLHEVLSDVEEEIKKFPFKKPLNSYQFFIQDQLSKAHSSGDFANRMRNLAAMYKNLSSDERAVYDKKSKEALNDYNKKKMEYLAEKNPESLKTPLFLFSQHWKSKDIQLTATQLKHKYEELPQHEKFKWVEKAVKLNAGIGVTSFLNKDEQRLYRGLPKSVGTPYSMFVKEMYAKAKQSHQGGGTVFAEIAQEWKKLPAEEKEKYKIACDKLKQEALKESKAINDEFGVQVSKKKIKRVKSENHKTKEMVESDAEDDVSPAAPEKTQKMPKKRKIPSEEAPRIHKKSKLEAKEAEFASPAPVTSTPHAKSKKRNNTLSSEGTADEEVTVNPFMVQIPREQMNSELSDTSSGKKKKKKKDKSSDNIVTESEAEASTSSSVSGGKKKKKDKEKSPQKSSSQSSHVSEAEVSTVGSVFLSKKSKKAAETTNAVPPPGERPPSTLLEFYAKYMYSGKPQKLQKSFEKLTKKEKKELSAQHNEKIEKYVGQLKTYLGSLSKEEAVLYVASVKASEDARASLNGVKESQEY